MIGNFPKRKTERISMLDFGMSASKKLGEELEWQNFNPEWIRSTRQTIAGLKVELEEMRDPDVQTPEPNKRLLATSFLSTLEKAEGELSDEMSEHEMNAVLLPIREQLTILNAALNTK